MKYTNKNQFLKRTIQPSEDSWSKLDSRLTAFEREKSNNKWTFLKYAASILIVFSAGFYFSQTTNQTSEKDVVIQPVLKVKEHKIQPIIEEPQNVLAASEGKETLNKSVQKGKIKNSISSKQHDEIAVLKIVNKQEAIVNVQISEVDSIENQKIKEQVVMVESIKTENGEVTDLEIEQLLAVAEKSLIAERKNTSKHSFSSSDLLAEIDYELDKDFKNRLFEAIVNTLKEPKNIFVNRDN